MSSNATRPARKGPYALPLPRRHRAPSSPGITVGLVAPDFAVELKPLGTGFVNLIKMMIAPVIFCTLVLGVGSVAKASQVGRVGGLALGYFVTMSFVALSIGLVVGNILQPGDGLKITPDVGRAAGKRARCRLMRSRSTDFILHIVPDNAGRRR